MREVFSSKNIPVVPSLGVLAVYPHPEQLNNFLFFFSLQVTMTFGVRSLFFISFYSWIYANIWFPAHVWFIYLSCYVNVDSGISLARTFCCQVRFFLSLLIACLAFVSNYLAQALTVLPMNLHRKLHLSVHKPICDMSINKDMEYLHPIPPSSTIQTRSSLRHWSYSQWNGGD
jgi:hypothetical protein